MVVIRDLALLIAPQNLKDFLLCIVVAGCLFSFLQKKQTVFAVSNR